MEKRPTHIRLFGTATDSIVDGPGLRYSVFTQGCPHHCPGCHNEKSQTFDGGYVAAIDELVSEIIAQGIIGGVTLSGGEPFSQPEESLELARQLKAHGYDIWIYSGYLYEDIMAANLGEAAFELLCSCDVLVDGPFIEALHAYDLQWKGSTNQRVIDVPASRAQNTVVLWHHEDSFPEPPASW